MDAFPISARNVPKPTKINILRTDFWCKIRDYLYEKTLSFGVAAYFM